MKLRPYTKIAVMGDRASIVIHSDFTDDEWDKACAHLPGENWFVERYELICDEQLEVFHLIQESGGEGVDIAS